MATTWAWSQECVLLGACRMAQTWNKISPKDGFPLFFEGESVKSGKTKTFLIHYRAAEDIH